jgi:hypothetical protein
MVQRFEAGFYWICGGFEPRRSRQSSFAALAENEDCRAEAGSEGGLRAPRISAANYLSR